MNILPQKLIFGSANLLTKYGHKSFFINKFNSIKLMKCARKWNKNFIFQAITMFSRMLHLTK